MHHNYRQLKEEGILDSEAESITAAGSQGRNRTECLYSDAGHKVSKLGIGQGYRFSKLTPSDILLSAKLDLLKAPQPSQAAPPARHQVFKYVSL